MIASEPRLCRHLHLPLQHGSDAVLKAMGRPYTAGYIRELLGRVTETAPRTAIGADVIVGFPGEDEQAFEESYTLIDALGFTYLHVFPFSPRPGTIAANLPGRPDDQSIRRRASRLRELSRNKRQAFAVSRIGDVEEVLVTGSCGGRFSGVSSSYLMVEAAGHADTGDLVPIRLSGIEEHTLRGETIE